MKAFRLMPVLLGAGVLAALSPLANSQSEDESPAQLSPVVARSLIAQARDVAASEIDVAYVLSGEKNLPKGFKSRSAAAVIYMATGFEDGHRRRRCHEQVFLYTPDFGWFLEEVVEEPFRDYLRIWSEKKGYLELK